MPPVFDQSTDPVIDTSADADAEMPGFLTGQQSQRPTTQPIPKRKRSFVERVFGNKKGSDAEQSKIAESDAPRMAAAEPEVGSIVAGMSDDIGLSGDDAGETPIEVAQPPQEALPEETMPQPAALGDAPDEIPEEPSRISAELDIPQTTMEASPEADTPEETPEATENRPTEARAKAVATAKVSAPQAPVADKPPEVTVEAATPPVQTTMQTESTMSASSYDQDQLDIPAFLRR